MQVNTPRNTACTLNMSRSEWQQATEARQSSATTASPFTAMKTFPEYMSWGLSGEGDRDQNSFTGDWLIWNPNPEARTVEWTQYIYALSKAFKVELMHLYSVKY